MHLERMEDMLGRDEIDTRETPIFKELQEHEFKGFQWKPATNINLFSLQNIIQINCKK